MDYFIASADKYQHNVADGRTLRAIPAALTTPRQGLEAGIAIIVHDRPRLVIPTADAIRLAHMIADTATQQIEDNR